MVCKCSIPGCKGIFSGTKKVMCFTFPQNKQLKKEWLTAILRKNFIPTKYSKVCELHFHEEIKKNYEYFHEKSGKLISVSLKKFRFKENAIPSMIPNCPAYFTKEKHILTYSFKN